jgi:hypothetical protein
MSSGEVYFEELIFKTMDERAGGSAVGQYKILHVQLHFADCCPLTQTSRSLSTITTHASIDHTKATSPIAWASIASCTGAGKIGEALLDRGHRPVAR